MFAKIVIDMQNDHIDDSYDYLIPEKLIDFIGIGTRVLVSFGFQDLLGYVIEIMEHSNFEKNIKPIKEVLDFEKELTKEQVELAKYISKEYYVSLASSLSLMIPSFLRGQKRNYLVVKSYDKLHPVLALLFEGKSRILVNQAIINNYALVKKEIENQNITIDYELYSYGKLKKEKKYTVKNFQKQRSEIRDLILEFVRENPSCTEEMIFSFVDCSQYLLNKMVQEEYLEVKEEPKLLENQTEKKKSYQYNFTFDQQQTIERYSSSRQNSAFLLFSNDEDFKINFFVNIIEENMKNSLSTVIVTPTIMIEEELVLFLKKVLIGYTIVSMSSKNSKSDNYEAYMNIKYNNFDVFVTTTSGVFMPYTSCGTIIAVDCDNPNYINENYPYYDAIDVLYHRAKEEKMKFLITSSSPLVKHYYEAECGKYSLLTSGSLIRGKVLLVDMKKEIMNSTDTILSATLKENIQLALDSNKQALLLINNKAYSNMLYCRSCNEVMKCPKCQISLTYYKEKNIAKCSYCDYKLSKIDECNNCHSSDIVLYGYGIEALKESLANNFVGKNILQVDSDTMKTSDDYETTILAIEDKTIDIIIGTNILTKYINRDSIEVYGVISSDRLLNSNDYRACEYTYNNIMRVINSKICVVQTYYIDNSIIRDACNGDYDSFYKKEIEKRKLLKYEPFYEMNKLTITGKFEDIYHFAYYFRKVYNAIIDGEALGPVYVQKSKGVKLILKHNNQFETVIKILEETKEHFKKSSCLVDFQRCPRVM